MKCRLEYPFETPPVGGWRAVAGGLYWLRLPLPFALDHINVWLLPDHETWTLVDAGTAGEALSIDDLSDIAGLPRNDPRVQLRRIAAGMLDELERPQHLHQRIQFRL